MAGEENNLFADIRGHCNMCRTVGFCRRRIADRCVGRINSARLLFHEVKVLSGSIASGFEGKRDGKTVHFLLKDAASVRGRLNAGSAR
jgi:hypothetical protein